MIVLVAGDYCPRGRLASVIEDGDYAFVFKDVRDITRQADLSVLNLECPIVTEKLNPIDKCGGHLSCTISAIKAIKYAGFNCVTLANNHLLDYGQDGVKETLKKLDTEGISHVGCGVDLKDASRILYKEYGGQCLAIVNCCEHEFSIATYETAGCNPLDPIKQFYAIRRAKQKADRVLVIVHGGHEHFQLPSPRMVDTYRFFIDAGADVVVNHHQHCFSGYERYKGKPIFYGLGNFCFEKASAHDGIWTEGFAVLLDMAEDSPDFSIYPYRQCAEEPSVKMLSKGSYDNKLNELNRIISSGKLLNEEINKYYSSCYKKYEGIFEPLYNRLFIGAKSLGLLPSFVGKKRKLAASNYVNCESHRDKLLYYLNKR